MSNRVLGIDFGTSTSHFALCPQDELRPSSLAFDSSTLGLESAVLFREGRNPLVGSKALGTWGEAFHGERRGYELHMLFKPHIATSLKARRVGVAFLKGALEEARKKGLHLERVEQILFGVPSEADRDWKKTILTVAEEAGFPGVELVDEPVGALLYHLYQKDLKPSESFGGNLVVDFGGGTCDFAWMHKLEVQASWGDMSLGGRLFDDLFYQILGEQNPELVSKLGEPGAEYYVHWYECRRLKESFSDAMMVDPASPWSGRAGHYGVIRNLSWEEFLRKASSYVPTESLKTQHEVSPKNSLGETVNLVEWFRRVLCEGLRKHGLQNSPPGRVVLAGGSSLWPFVSQVLEEELGIAREQILRSHRPVSVIAEGLALLPALRKQYGVVRKNLQEDLPRFMKKDLRELLDRALRESLDKVGSYGEALLFQGEVRRNLEDFRLQGGTLQELEETLARSVEGKKSALDAYGKEEEERLVSLLSRETALLVRDWFYRFGINSFPPRLGQGRKGAFLGEKDRVHVPLKELSGKLSLLLEGPLALVISTATALLWGSTGLSLVVSGPLGIILGGVAGLLLYRGGRRKIQCFLKTTRLPSFITKRIITEKKVGHILDQGARHYKESLEQHFCELWSSQEPELLQEVRELVEKEIESLSALQTL